MSETEIEDQDAAGSELKRLLDAAPVLAAAKALWESSSHPLLAQKGFPTDWESQSESFRRIECKKIKKVLRAAIGAV